MTDPRDEWDDDRLDRAYRVRFDVAPPPELLSRILASSSSNREPSGRTWAWLRPRSAALAAGASLLVAVALLASSAGWLGPVPRLGPGPSVTAPSRSASSDLVPQPFPRQVTTRFDGRVLPVLSVQAAIDVKDRSADPIEIAVEGWFTRFAVRCLESIGGLGTPEPLIPPIESCNVGFIWLMAAPETLSDGFGIHPPTGPAFNAITDWSPPPYGTPSQVVFVGHFHDSGAARCAAVNRAGCEARFVVDQVAWRPISSLGYFPVQVAGRDVISVSDAILIRDSGSSSEIAVAGWYQPPPMLFCSRLRVFPPLEGSCAIDLQWLLADPEEAGGLLMSGGVALPLGPAIHPVFEPGRDYSTAYPRASTGTAVVFVGHFNDPRSYQGCQNPEACAQRFVVDTVAWANSSFLPAPSPS
jgi:hypothetical protein